MYSYPYNLHYTSFNRIKVFAHIPFLNFQKLVWNPSAPSLASFVGFEERIFSVYSLKRDFIFYLGVIWPFRIWQVSFFGWLWFNKILTRIGEEGFQLTFNQMNLLVSLKIHESKKFKTWIIFLNICKESMCGICRENDKA